MDYLAANILRTIDVLAETMVDDGCGDKLIAIHAIRSLFNVDKASFDRTMMEMRSNGMEIIAISDYRRATKEQLDASIEGVNETLFYVIA